MHLADNKSRRSQPDGQQISITTTESWARMAGSYLGTVIRQQVGGQWGYVTRERYRIPVVRTHQGYIANPFLLVMDHIINGPCDSIAGHFRRLIKNGASATPRDQDLVSNIPGYCWIFLGRSHFHDGGLPLEDVIPRDELDFTVDSLHYLDQYLTKVLNQLESFSSPGLSNLILAAGAYLGEVVRGGTIGKNTWRWESYDDYAIKHPEFSKKRRRCFEYMAILDSNQHSAYPLDQIASILKGANTSPPPLSTHAYARQLVSMRRGELSGITLDSIDVRKCIDSLPPAERDYLSVNTADWVAFDPLSKVIEHFPALLEKGRLVWGHIVQANEDLFDFGGRNLPGDIVYDPQGIFTPEELAPIANTLFGLRTQTEELDPNDPAQARLLAIAEHLNAEIARTFGMRVPRHLSAEPLLLSSVYFERKHLPGQVLVLPYFPVLIHDSLPGFVMIFPSCWWPQPLLDRVEKRLDDNRLASWMAAWEKLAAGRDEKEETYFQNSIKNLKRYVSHGQDGQRIADSVQMGMIPFRVETSPPPLEWEWNLPYDLQSYAEYLLREVEADRARGLPLNVPRAKDSFFTRYLAQMIYLHRLLLCPTRGLPYEAFTLDPDEIQYVALGLAAGWEELALKAANLLCLAWQYPNMYSDIMRPEVRATFLLFASHLGIQIPNLKPFHATPHLDALVENDRWRTVNNDELRSLLEAACKEHVRAAPEGPFRGLPAAILLVLKLRKMAGLDNPALCHPLFAKPLELPGETTSDEARGGILADVFHRMIKNGFRADLVEQAMVTHSPLVVDWRLEAIPLHPDLYQPSIRVVKLGETKVYGNDSSTDDTERINRFVDGSVLVFGYLPRILTWLTLAYGAKAVFSEFASIADSLSTAEKMACTVWMTIPFIMLGWASLVEASDFRRDSGLLIASVMLYLFGTGAYSINLPQSPRPEDVTVFIWVPVVQMIWSYLWVRLWKR